MKSKRNNAGTKLKDDQHDPLAEDLDFNQMKIVGWGAGWAEVPKRLRGPKHLREARAWLKRKNASAKSPRRAA